MKRTLDPISRVAAMAEVTGMIASTALSRQSSIDAQSRRGDSIAIRAAPLHQSICLTDHNGNGFTQVWSGQHG